MAISKITTRGMSGDTLEAGDIAPNAIGASELADNAVDTDAIAATSITEAKLNADVTDGSAITTAVKPHIQPGTLYPAYRGLLTDNTGSQNITDSGTGSHALTVVGTAHHSGVQKKVGSTSLRFDGASRVVVPASTDWDLPNSADWTFECWVYMRDPTANWGRIIAKDSDNNGWALHMNGATGQVQFGHDSTSFASGDLVGNSNSVLTANTWTHIAVVHDDSANNFKLYKDGTAVIEKTGITNYWSSTNKAIRIGDRYNGAYHFDGFLDQIRISNSQRYSSNFTPSTSAFTSDSNTKLLIQSDAGGHSGAYGTAQSDGRKYYYTDIRGSKPIKDPRIGAHFGAQRHKFRSLQQLEQESSMQHDTKIKVSTVDGREWLRYVGDSSGGITNNDYGVRIQSDADAQNFYEIVSYFSSATVSAQPRGSGNRAYRTQIDGGAESSDINSFQLGHHSPLVAARFVDSGSFVSLSINETLGIHTLKLMDASTADDPITHGIELIAQDTGSTARRSQINIPAQNVVSYGKKFSIGSDTLTDSVHTHYDPFNGWSGAKTPTQLEAVIDTGTSLGMDNWKGGTSNYYRPWNGGRVVKWVASDGTIKTSVTMMPPNAQNVSQTTSNQVTNTEVQNGTNGETINFNNLQIDESLSEIAKDFKIREFGNGAANEGTNTGGTYQDISMMSGADGVAYCMDDGLTTCVSNDHRFSGASEGLHRNGSGGKFFHTFIGTGLSRGFSTTSIIGHPNERQCWLQNLPYGTHIISHIMDGTDTGDWYLDGVRIYDNSGGSAVYHNVGHELKIHQPKMPPIPEDACIIADYMLMADFVKQTDAEDGQISKGVRYQSASRDIYYVNASGDWTAHGHATAVATHQFGFRVHSSAGASTAQLPFFGTTATAFGESTNISGWAMTLGGSAATETILDNSVSGYGDAMTITETVPLGLTDTVVTFPTAYNFFGIAVATPTHTSSHYQEFEDPYLKTLVGGDRNMEQTNLVVTADGKTWDQVTRDTSYIGNVCLSTTNTSTHVSSGSATVYFEEWRGAELGKHYYFNKDFAIAYDRVICLVPGEYEIHARTIRQSNGNHCVIRINGTNVMHSHGQTEGHDTPTTTVKVNLVRGDEVQIHGKWYASSSWSHFYISRV